MKILIIRSNADKVNINSYNLQEIGLARALVRKGHKCDIVYYTDKREMECQYIYEDKKRITIYWCPAIKVFNNGVYTKILNKSFLENYDVIQTSEYNQIMIYLLNRFSKKPTVLYHGPYKDLKIKFLNKLYDTLFLNSIVKNTKQVISKSVLSEKYLLEKGFSNITTIGVGLDTSRFEQNYKERDIYKELNISKNDRILLYIGRLEERRNIKFLLEIIKSISSKEKNIKLLIIGNGSESDKKDYFDYAEELGIMNRLIYKEKMNQSDLKQVYEISDIFLLPTKYEIFGMVLLESMYFGLPVITSKNGGSLTLIENYENGIVIDDFNLETWTENIIRLLIDESLKNKIGNNAHKTIKEKFTWDALSDRYIKVYNKALKQNQ